MVSTEETDTSVEGTAYGQASYSSLVWAHRFRTLKGVLSGVGWLLSGKVIALAANGVLVLLLGRWLVPEQFGAILAALSAQIILSRVLLVGADVGTFRVETLDPRWAPHLAGASLLLVLSCIAVASVLACVTTLPFAVKLLPGPPWFGPVVVAGASGIVLHDYVYWRLLAKTGHRSASLMTSGTTLTRLALVAALLLRGVADPFWLLIAMAMAPLTISSVLLWRSHPTFRGLPRASLAVLLRYCGWQAASSIVGTVALQHGTLLLSASRKPAEAGAFGLAITIGLAANVVTQSLHEFLTARAFHVGPDHNLAKFLLKASAFTLAVSLGLFTVLLAAFSVVGVVLHPRLPISAAVFLPITLALTALLLHTPFEAVCHFFARPDVIVAGKAARLVTGFALGVWWGAEQGAAGVSKALLAGTVVSLLMISAFSISRIARRQREVGTCE